MSALTKRKQNKDWLSNYSSPFSLLEGFEDILRPSVMSPFDSIKSFSLKNPIDIRDNGDKYVVEADLPGFDKKDINIDISDGILSISAHKEKEEDLKDKSYVLKERFSSSFTRSISLNDEVDQSNVSANYKNGVLELSIPKKQKTKDKKIKIEIQ